MVKRKVVDKKVYRVLGFLELGMCHESLYELRKLDQLIRCTSAVVELEMHIYIQLGWWYKALNYARKLQMLDIGNPSGYIHEAFCLHEMGKTFEALETLNRGPKLLRTHPLFYYNLACYNAAIGKQKDALASLKKAFVMDSSLQILAHEDKDLSSLKNKIKNLSNKTMSHFSNSITREDITESFK